MNKKMREIFAKIEAKTAEAKSYMDGENKDLDKANAALDEVAELKKEYALEERLYTEEKNAHAPTENAVATKTAEKNKDAVIAAFGKAAKNHFRVNKDDGDSGLGFPNEGTPADGGYTVPVDIWTQIEYFREAEFSLLDLVRRETVHTNTGRRTFKKRSQYSGFTAVAEGGKITYTSAPQFEPISFSIDKYAGYFPVTNELLADSDANVANVLMDWIARESRATANNLILSAIMSNGDAVNFENLDGLKYALNVTLGLFKGTSRIITNDDGLQYLDTLKDAEGDYILRRNPTDPIQLQIAAGASVVPLVVVPNAILASTPVDATESTAAANQIPFIVGDLKEGVIYWDRMWMSIDESRIASIGDLNAFEQDLTIFRAIEREDVTLRDTDAFVHGYIQTGGEAISGE